MSGVICAVMFSFARPSSRAVSAACLMDRATQEEMTMTSNIISMRIFRPFDLEMFLSAFFMTYIPYLLVDFFFVFTNAIYLFTLKTTLKKKRMDKLLYCVSDIKRYNGYEDTAPVLSGR